MRGRRQYRHSWPVSAVTGLLVFLGAMLAGALKGGGLVSLLVRTGPTRSSAAPRVLPRRHPLGSAVFSRRLAPPTVEPRLIEE